MSKIDDTLKQLGLETERVATYEVAITDIARVPRADQRLRGQDQGNRHVSPMKGFA